MQKTLAVAFVGLHLYLLGFFITDVENVQKISFGGIPNSSSIDILMPYAIFDYMGPFLRSSFAHVDKVIPVNKTIPWLLLSRLQGNKPHQNSPEPSEPCLRNLHHFTPELSGTFRNPPPEPTPAHSGTLRNLPEPSSGTYTSTRRSLSGLKTPLAYAVGEKNYVRVSLPASHFFSFKKTNM